MRHLRVIRSSVLAGLLWAAMAYACIFLRDGLNAAMLVWYPSGVAVAAYQAHRRADWPVLSVVLLAVKTVTIWTLGSAGAWAAAYALASTLQSLVAAQLGIMALGGRKQVPRRFSHVVGLFAAAVAGCLAGALVAIPFRAEQTLAEFSWWFLANVLGIMLVAPLLLILRNALGFGPKFHYMRFESPLVFFLLACGIVAFVAFQEHHFVLMPLLLTAVVLAAVRYGQMASLMVILLYAAIGTWLSVTTGSPLPVLQWSQTHSVLAFQQWLLVMMATVLPISAMLLKRQELQQELLERNATMRESLALFELAEQTVHIGRWRLDLVTGRQDWSGNMLEMNGLPRSLAPDPGDVRHRLPNGGEELFGQIAKHRNATEIFSFAYRIRPTNQLERILRMSVRNEFDEQGNRVAVFGVARDVTEQVRREEALDMARGRAMQLATEAQKLANTDQLTGLPNRRCTFARLESMVAVAEDGQSALSAIMFDIDHFKAVNDTHGHQCGDRVIRHVADLAGSQTRRGDLIGRIGGEEFVWLIAGTPQDVVNELAERLRASVEDGFRASTLPPVTISLGMAHFHDGDTCETLLGRADAALYSAKEGGRNRVKRAA